MILRNKFAKIFAKIIGVLAVIFFPGSLLLMCFWALGSWIYEVMHDWSYDLLFDEGKLFDREES